MSEQMEEGNMLELPILCSRVGNRFLSCQKQRSASVQTSTKVQNRKFINTKVQMWEGSLGPTWGGSREGRNETCSLGRPVLRSRPSVQCTWLYTTVRRTCPKKPAYNTAYSTAILDSLLHSWSAQPVFLWVSVFEYVITPFFTHPPPAPFCTFWRNLIFWIYSQRTWGPQEAWKKLDPPTISTSVFNSTFLKSTWAC